LKKAKQFFISIAVTCHQSRWENISACNGKKMIFAGRSLSGESNVAGQDVGSNMKKYFSVCCGIVLLLMSVVFAGCSNSSGSDSSSSGSGIVQSAVKVQDAEGSNTQDLSPAIVAQNMAKQHPYETIKNNPSYYYVSQESALCAATSFYMAMKYYGDHLTNIKTGINDEDCPEEITDKIYYPTELSATSNIATYIEYIDDQFNSLPGIRLSSLAEAAEGLLDESGSKALYSEVMIDNYGDDLTGTQDNISEQKRNIFLNRIVPFLNTGSPVLLHLWRSPVLGIPSSGHYVLVIGYDDSEKVVYFMDPNDLNHQGNQCDCVVTYINNTNICFIQKVDFDLFIEDYWYKSDDSLVLNARWDGNWVGFRH